MKTGLYSSKQFRYLSLTLLLINKCPLSIPQTTGGRQTCVILIKGKNMHHGKNELFSYTLSRKHQLIQKQKFSNFPRQQRQLKTTISIRQGLFIILGTNSTFEPTTLDKTLGILTQQLVKMTRYFLVPPGSVLTSWLHIFFNTINIIEGRGNSRNRLFNNISKHL